MDVGVEEAVLLRGADRVGGRSVSGLLNLSEFSSRSCLLRQEVVLKSKHDLSADGASVGGLESEYTKSVSECLMLATTSRVGLPIWVNVDVVARLMDNELTTLARVKIGTVSDVAKLTDIVWRG